MQKIYQRIDLFITFVGLQSSGIIIKSDSTLVKLGHLTEAPVLLAIFGIMLDTWNFSNYS
jgi:AGZA family xanthine/uracil permease-like MFS transporter